MEKSTSGRQLPILDGHLARAVLFFFSGTSVGYFLLVLLLVWVALAWAEAGFMPTPAVRKWLEEPGNPVRLATWVIAVALVALTLLSPTHTTLGSLRSEAISTAFAVIVINELGLYRSALQEKRNIIEQMGSPVNDAALEAVRLARKHSWLVDGSLSGAELVEANLVGASLGMANLQDSDLSKADLEYADLVGANLEGASLKMANLKGAQLHSANLKGAQLHSANLEGASLGMANLEDARLAGANLNNAHLGKANLKDVGLGGTKLQGAILYKANLTGAFFGGADLGNADLVGANLEGATYDTRTIWPVGFNPVAVGAILIETNKQD